VVIWYKHETTRLVSEFSNKLAIVPIKNQEIADNITVKDTEEGKSYTYPERLKYTQKSEG